jgi:hypothetical protein
MTVGEAHPQVLASGTAAMAAGHVGGGPGFVDEDEALRIQIALAIEPVLPLLQDVGAVLLDGVASLFLRVMPRRTKKRCSPATDTCRPTPISAWRNSSSEMSLRASQIAKMSAPRCSTRRERLSPP